MANYYLPEGSVNDSKYKAFQMLKDIWWRICTKAGNLLRAPITRYGPDGLPDGETTAEAEFGWNRENFAKVNDKLDKIMKKLEVQ